jgi:hypothetical protein
MQIDFHHAVTYVVARLAGFEHADASTVAYSSQHVDDAVDQGKVSFANGAMYERISSAHKMLDYRNFEALADHLVWVPFHFLPGNGGLPAGQDPPGTFVQKLICRPNSPIAQHMIRSVIEGRQRRYGLHRLGISMHVYADTWAHQGFVGINHEVNHATNLTGPDGTPDRTLMDRLENFFVNRALPLGHGAVLGNPDRPYLVWGYTNGFGQRIERNNPREFLDAVDHMARAMQRYRMGDPDAQVPGIPERDRAAIFALMNETRQPEAGDRHQKWLAEIARGVFSFGPATVVYEEEGKGSWVERAFGVLQLAKEPELAYRPEFLTSDWKLFHDALQAHRFDVMHHILPEYGICAA